MLTRTFWLRVAVTALAVGGLRPALASGQAPPPGAVVEPIASSQSACTSGMSVAGFGHAPDGRPIVAWNECGQSRVFWSRPAVAGGPWDTLEFQSDRRWQGGGDADTAHRLLVTPADGAPMLVYAAPGPYNELNTYRVNLDQTLAGGFVSTPLENIALPQQCVYPTYSLAASPTATATGVQWASALPSCNQYGALRINGGTIAAAVVVPRVAYAVAPDGGQHLLWSSESNLFYTRRPVGVTSYQTTTLSTTLSRLGGEVALTADAAGVLHALVRGYAPDSTFDFGTMMYLRSADGGTTWSAPEFVDPWDAVPANGGIHTDITLAVDEGGVPAVAYWKSRQQLWYARRDGPGPSWNHAQVASRPNVDVSRATALDFDARNQPVLVYFDQPNNRLVAARTLAPAPAVTVTTMTASTLRTTPGRTVFFTATVRNADANGVTPSGPFTFIDAAGGEYRTTVDATGVAESTAVGFPLGTHIMRGRYEGTADFEPSEASLTITVESDTAPEIRPVPDRVDLVGTTNIAIPIEITGGSVQVTGLPPGAIYDDSEGPTIVAPIIRFPIGVWYVTVTVSNGSGTASTSFTWRIRENTPPLIYDPGAQHSLAGRPVELRLRAADADNDPLRVTVAELPPGLSIVVLDQTTLVISGVPTQAGTFNVFVQVSDGFVTFGRHFTWTVDSWSDLHVTAGLTMEPAYAGDRQARGLLSVRAVETGGSVLAFTQPQVVAYDIDLPPGAVFAGVEGPRTPDGLSALGRCSADAGRLRCWQPISGVGGVVSGAPIDQWLQLHLILPVRAFPMTARVQAHLPYDLDPNLADNDVEATVVPVIRPATGRRAIVIVVDDNETQQDFITYRGLAEAARAIEERVDLTSVGVPQEVIDLARTVAPDQLERMVADLRQRMSGVNTAIKDRLIASAGNTAGCYPAMLRTLRDAPVLSLEHPFRGFLDQYNEAWVASCLREMATPYFDHVEVLNDREATFFNFRRTVERLHAEGYTIDLLLNLHGCGTPQTRNNVNCGDNPLLAFSDGPAYRDGLVTNGGAPFGQTLQSINSFFNGTSGYFDSDNDFVAAAEPGYVRLNSVYMVSCWGANFNQMWIDMGARASNGSEELNFEVLSSPFAFLDQYTRLGLSLDRAASVAFEQERVLFEGPPTGIPVAYDFTWLPNCGHCRYAGDLRVIYEGTFAQTLALWYGEDHSRPVQPVASSRRVGMLATPIAQGQSEVVLVDSGTGARLVGVTVTAVEEPGVLVLTTMTEGPALGAHRSLGTPAVHYDLSVSAVLSGATSVCFTYDEGRFVDESTMQLLHYEAGAWVNRTTSLDTTQNVVCGVVTSFSPFAVVEFTNRPPVAAAGPDVTVEASSPQGAAVVLDGAGSTDPEHDALMFAWSWPGGSAVGVTARVTLPQGSHVVTLTVSDAYGAVSTDSLTVTVAPPPLTGRMWGHGHLEDSDVRYQFAFDASRSADGTLKGGFELKVTRSTAVAAVDDGRKRRKFEDSTHDRFSADALSFVAFTHAPATTVATSRRGGPDTVTLAGTGVWNGESDYHFEARATTRATPGRPHGWLAVTVTAPDGRVVATVAGDVSGGQIVSRVDAMSKR